MSSVGALDVDIMHGVALTPRPTVETWETAGLDGFGARTNGSRAPEFQLLTIFYADSSADADAHGITANALQSSIVTVVDDWTDSQANVLILDVDCANFKQPCIYQGNANAVRCEIRWRMRVTQ